MLVYYGSSVKFSSFRINVLLCTFFQGIWRYEKPLYYQLMSSLTCELDNCLEPFWDRSHKSDGFLILPEATKVCGHNVYCSAPRFWTGPYLIQKSCFPMPAYFFHLPCSATWCHDCVLYHYITNNRFNEGVF